jgi:hypothetical protein
VGSHAEGFREGGSSRHEVKGKTATRPPESNLTATTPKRQWFDSATHWFSRIEQATKRTNTECHQAVGKRGKTVEKSFSHPPEHATSKAVRTSGGKQRCCRKRLKAFQLPKPYQSGAAQPEKKPPRLRRLGCHCFDLMPFRDGQEPWVLAETTKWLSRLFRREALLV